jgi:hypothetical protein
MLTAFTYHSHCDQLRQENPGLPRLGNKVPRIAIDLAIFIPHGHYCNYWVKMTGHTTTHLKPQDENKGKKRKKSGKQRTIV